MTAGHAYGKPNEHGFVVGRNEPTSSVPLLLTDDQMHRLVWMGVEVGADTCEVLRALVHRVLDDPGSYSQTTDRDALTGTLVRLRQ